MSDTPRTDKLIAELDANHEVAIPFVWRQMVNLARELESDLAAMTAQRDEAEELHRMQLVAIDVVSSCNTYGALAQHRVEKDNPYWTPIYEDVFVAVEREIKERVAKEAAEARALASEKDAERLREKARLQRRELRRLNKVLGPYWAGFRKGLGMEAEGKLRLTMIQAFGSEKVRAAEHAAIDASRARA